MESTRDPSWESPMDLLPNPADTGPFAAGSGWSVGFGTHQLTPKAMEVLPEGISFSISSTLLGFFFSPGTFHPFPQIPGFPGEALEQPHPQPDLTSGHICVTGSGGHSQL